MYMPEFLCNDEEVEKKKKISDIFHQEGKVQVNIMGYFNNTVEEGSTNKVVAPFEFGRRNDRGKCV